MTRVLFDVQMRRLSGLKFAPKSGDTHWEALQDLADGQLAAAVTKAQRACHEFPSPAVLRGFADEVLRAAALEPDEDRSVPLEAPRSLAVPATLGHLVTGSPALQQTREWVYFCQDCQDSGWIDFWCGTSDAPKPWLVRRPCGRVGLKAHSCESGHEWVSECPCASTNPDVQKRKAQGAQVKRGQDDAA